MDALQNTGLQEDCPFSQEEAAEHLTPESAREVPDEQFAEYAGRLNAYLQVKLMPKNFPQFFRVLCASSCPGRWSLRPYAGYYLACPARRGRQYFLSRFTLRAWCKSWPTPCLCLQLMSCAWRLGGYASVEEFPFGGPVARHNHVG